ncbi:MAG: hypothetical protein AAFZ65_06310 [Planctomycetota bacterium]
MQRILTIATLVTVAATSGCLAPPYAGAPAAGAPGGYVPVQASADPTQPSSYGGSASDPSTGAWAPEIRGAAERSMAGGAWTANSSAQGQVPASRIVSPGSSVGGAPSAARYGDNGAVRSDPYGAMTQLDAPARELEPGGTGRPLMLQQYQAVLEERDALRIEVDALTHQLQLMQVRIQELQGELQGGDMRATGLEQELESMRRRVLEVEQQNEDLSARLVTAQIRRLEAEKELIQVLIDNQRGQRTSVAMPDSALLGNGPATQPIPGAERP